MQNHEYCPYIMQAAKICAKNYANGKNLQVDTTRHSLPPTASCAYQQLSDAVRLLTACVPQVFLPAYRPRPARTHQLTHNR